MVIGMCLRVLQRGHILMTTPYRSITMRHLMSTAYHNCTHTALLLLASSLLVLAVSITL